MDTTLLQLTAIAILALIIVFANAADRRPSLRPLVSGVLLTVNAVILLYFGVLLPASSQLSPETSLLTRLIAVVVSIGATLPLLASVRLRLTRFIPARSQVTGLGFDPQSAVHMTAMVYVLYLFGNTLLQLAVQGGLQGIAEQFDGIDLSGLAVQNGLFVVFAALGVGMSVRRNPRSVLKRLGLTAPSLSELLIGGGVAVLMLGVAYVVGLVWQIVISQETFEQQTQVSTALSQGITTLGVAFTLSGLAAVGEEIIFRGALQPVFGLIFTSIAFALIHVQYAFTPAVLIILVVGLGMGWLRKRYNTTVAIAAHFLYNFAQMFLVVMARYWLENLPPGLR